MRKSFTSILNPIIPESLKKTKTLQVILRDYENIKLLILREDWGRLEYAPPQRLHFNTIDVCNANCVFCGYQFTKPEGIMSMDVYKEALEQFMDMGGHRIGITPMIGEPLLDPYLFERLQIANSYPKKPNIVMYTNGILLKQNIDKILNSGIDELYISTAIFDEGIYQKVYRVDRYREVLEGICKLLKKNKESRNPLTINIEFRGGNNMRIETTDFKDKILPLIDENVKIGFLFLFDGYADQIKEKDLPEGMYLRPFPHVNPRLPCIRTFDALVLPNGDIRICNCQFGRKGRHDELVLGNITKQSLKEIWYGSKCKAIRRTFLEPKSNWPDVCRTCRIYWPISKSRAVDLWGEDYRVNSRKRR